MTENISGSGPVNPHDEKMYKQEYKQSADLFKKALDQYEKSDNAFQKAEFKDVMDKAMNILNESAKGMIRKDLEEKNKKIARDYETFQKYPGDHHAVQQLQKDLDEAEKSMD